jgi:hypothetical protein
MSLPPLTHHEILTLIAPFARRGRHVDLAASDRLQRRLAFRPLEHRASVNGNDGLHALPALRETMELHNPETGQWRLSWRLGTADGLQATLQAEGTEPGELLERVERVPPRRQFHVEPGAVIALGHRLPKAASSCEPALVLRRAEARLAGLTLHMSVSGVSGYPAEFELRRGEGEGADVLTLPDDLLAVLGRPWDRLNAVRGGWQGSVQLRGAEPRRSRDAEARLQTTVRHLVRTLAVPPARFHQRHLRARWGVALRRTVPLLVGLSVVAAALWVQKHAPAQRSVLALLANVAPPLLMGLFFLRREMPRLELPRVPLCPRDTAWRPLALNDPPPRRFRPDA